MKTPARITQGPDANSNSRYDRMFIEILAPKYKSKMLSGKHNPLETVGVIEFFKPTGVEKDKPWILQRYKVESENPAHFEIMAKTIRKILKDRPDCFTQPEDVIAILGIEEYVFYRGSFIPKKWNGRQYYEIRHKDQLWRGLVATGPTDARKQFDADTDKPAGCEIVFTHKISLHE